jgi:cellulose 1,4-beta-cellobiosidase
MAATPPPTEFKDTTAASGQTYYYEVKAVNTEGDLSVPSNVVELVTVPAVPTGLAATGGIGQVALSWDADTGATSYHVKRATSSAGPYTTVGSPTEASFTDTRLDLGATYYYEVSALDIGGESLGSAWVVTTTTNAPEISISGTEVSFTTDGGYYAASILGSVTSGGPYTDMGNPTDNPFDIDPVRSSYPAFHYFVMRLVLSVSPLAVTDNSNEIYVP